MANGSKIVITAGLKVPETVHNIQKELDEQVAPNLKLEIACNINTSNLSQIQSQLNEMSESLSVNVNTSGIQQSISQAVKAEPVKINVTAEINKGELQRQAKEIEKTIGIVYPTGQTEALRTELKELLSEYQKVFDTSGYSEEAENQMAKILQFALNYKQEERLVNEELKHQQERIKEIQREQQKVFITAKQYVALQKEAEAQGTNVKVMLDRTLGGSTGWTNDINKISNPNKPYYWSDFAHEVNSINPLKDAIVNEGDIVQGVRDLADIFSKSFTQIDDSIEKNKAELNNWAIFLMETVGKVTGRSPFADSVWIDFGTDEIKQTEQNVQALAKGMQTIAALKENIKSSDPNGVQSVTADWTQDAERNLNGFVLNVHKATGEVERLHYALDETGKSFERIQITGSDSGVERMLVKATQAANNLERKMINLKAAADDQSAPRPITSEESIGKVTEAYNKATSAIEKLRTADATTFTELDNEARKAVDELNNVIKTARNADTAATKLRAKPIETIKAEELSNLDKFTATISGSAIPNVENLIQKVETLREFLGKVNDKQGLTDYLNRLTEVTADFKALEVQAKAVNKALGDLDKLSTNTQFARNAQNPDVTSQLANIDALKAKYQQLFVNIGNAKTPEDLQRISESLSQLKPEFDAVTQSSNELSNSLKNNSSAEKLESDIRNLTNRVETFANTNKRATESLKLMRSGVTFADEWKRITEQLKSGNLDDNAIRRLSNDLRNFQAEARNANLTTSRFFTDMGNQLRMLVTRWLSLYAVIGRVTSALNDLKEVDKILTEIAKSSDVTRESLEELGNAAFETANQYGRTAADYLYGVQEFSRAGFRGDQLTGLTEVSLLAQSAGNIETDLANSYVIATNAAYGYKGSVEELTEVLDRQNYVTNNYALNMTDLANATKIAASQAAQSGVEIDEMTAALATMISSTQQGGEIASRALRGKRAIRTLALYRCEPIIA